MFQAKLPSLGILKGQYSESLATVFKRDPLGKAVLTVRKRQIVHRDKFSHSLILAALPAEFYGRVRI